MESSKEFVAVWGVEFVSQEYKIVPFEFFVDRGGYEDEDLSGIDSLEIGDVWTAPNYSTHKIFRVK